MSVVMLSVVVVVIPNMFRCLGSRPRIYVMTMSILFQSSISIITLAQQQY